MSRKQYMESIGATCSNWTWAWSFINHEEKMVVFGAWDIHTAGNTALILSKEWQLGDNGRRKPGFTESMEHLRLVEEEGYRLMTFPIEYSDSLHDEGGGGPSRIKSFKRELREKVLKRVAGEWYASDNLIGITLPEEVSGPEKLFEGSSVTISINAHERNTKARAACIEHHGCRCFVCSIDFEEAYGAIGEGFIHVHHVIPLSEVREEYEVNPIQDLIPVCPNCHAIIHRTTPCLSVEQLREHLRGGP